MRENESDSGDGWRGPDGYISPWAARDPDGTDQARTDSPDLPPESGRPDTIAFGSLADEAGGPGQGSYGQRGYGDPWYGGDRDEPGYGSYAGPGGQHGSGSGEYGPGSSEGAGFGSGGSGGGGFGSGGWDQEPPPPGRRRGHLLVYLAVAAVAAVVGAGLTRRPPTARASRRNPVGRTPSLSAS